MATDHYQDRTEAELAAALAAQTGRTSDLEIGEELDMTDAKKPQDSSELLKRALAAIDQLQAKLAQVEAAKHEPIAIVGIGCRFPGADERGRVLAQSGRRRGFRDRGAVLRAGTSRRSSIPIPTRSAKPTPSGAGS